MVVLIILSVAGLVIAMWLFGEPKPPKRKGRHR